MYFALNAFKETLKCNTQVTLFKRITLSRFSFSSLKSIMREILKINRMFVISNILETLPGSLRLLALTIVSKTPVAQL
jgi:hypothetical protein